MLKRTLTTLLLIPPVVYLIGWSPKWLFVLAVVIAVVLALREYFALCRAMGFKVFSLVGYALAAALCLVRAYPDSGRGFFSLSFILLLTLLIPTLALGPSTELKDYLVATSATIFGILYIGLTLSYLIPIRFPRNLLSDYFGGGPQGICPGRDCLLFLFLVVWAGDICAYLVGRSMGRIPFLARISPRKTWEGAMAGFAGSILAAWAFDHWIWKTGEVKAVILIAGCVAVAGQIGDLVESAIKRGANLKDSGTLLPGHGGFLDRIDSLLFAAPALWLAINLLGVLFI
jgi:phosphatidate cytidylyltransferase